nr:hypothetical protein [Tanacetum cinerariifolium]
MAKKDMDLYHSRITPDDLNDLIIKYKIPRDPYPRLPSKEFVMSELPDDAIGIYHQIFDFSGVRIPFSSFLLALIKHYRVHFSKLGPLGLNKRAIPDAMVWRHPEATIDDPRPAAGSFNIADVRRLSTYVMKLRDMPEGVLVLSGLSQVWKNCFCDLVLQGADGNAGSTTQPNLFVGDSDDEINGVVDTCVEILLVTRLHYVVAIPPSWNQGRSFSDFTAEGSNTRDSRGKGIMVDDVVAPSSGASRPRPSSEHAPSFKDVSGDAIHTNFFSFSTGPYYATYPKGCVARIASLPTRSMWVL